MFNNMKRIGVIIWAVTASVLAVIGFVLLKRKNNVTIEEHANYAKETTKQNIEATPSDVLVDSAPNAQDLQRERQSITERFRSEVRNRLEQKLHRD